MHAIFWFEDLKGEDHSKDVGVDGRIILEWILETQGVKVWAGFIRLKTETNGGPLWTR
jgi:hypothetical protein